MKWLITSAALTSVLSLGCATHRYGRELPVTDAERSSLTCAQIDVEIAKTEAFLVEIHKGTPGGAAVLGFFGDFGIGNSMERTAARKSGEARMAELLELRRTRGCPEKTPLSPPSETANSGPVPQPQALANDEFSNGAAITVAHDARAYPSLELLQQARKEGAASQWMEQTGKAWKVVQGARGVVVGSANSLVDGVCVVRFDGEPLKDRGDLFVEKSALRLVPVE